MSTAFNDWLDANIGETCCGQCEADTCYVDYITGEKEQGNE